MNEVRLIDANALKDFAYINKGNFNTVEGIREWIDNAPTVDTPTYTDIIEANKEGYNTARRLYERPKGEWLHKEFNPFLKEYGQCSTCLQRERVGNFCRNCGADMRGEEE